MNGDHFECKDILLKCPSKYKDDVSAAGKSIQAANAIDENGYVSSDSLAKK
jgi:cytochrome c-type biogenesis protein CcmE